MITLDALSGKYYRLPVAFRAPDGTVLDPTGDPVAFAFLPAGTKPGTADWHSGLWEPTGPRSWAAKVLLGPAGAALTPGIYTVWIRVTDNPEVPTEPVDLLAIT